MAGRLIAASVALAALVAPATAVAVPVPSLSAPEERPLSAARAKSVLVGTEQVSPGVTRYRYDYGPLVAGPGENLILLGPVTIEKPPGDGYVTRIQPDLVDASGETPPVETVHMHHAVFLNMSTLDTTWPTLPERFYAFSEEKTISNMPEPYGYPVRTTDAWAMNYMLHNQTPRTYEVYLRYDIDWVPKESELAREMKPVRPIWLDVRNGEVYPVFDVLRGSGGDGRYTYPDEAGDPYGDGPKLNEWVVDRPVTIFNIAGHVHPGGLYTDLDVIRGDKRVRLFRSNARYFDPAGPVSWDLAMTQTPRSWRARLKRGDILRISATFDTTRASWYEQMGAVAVTAADDQDGPDPFEADVYTEGDVTHGPHPAASNRGGGPTSLPDARSLPDGAATANTVSIAEFRYMPGDLSLGGDLGNPPTIRPGDRLSFVNVDSAPQIYHTVTSCTPPCNGSAGVSYPIADGPFDFDSGQLGFGPPDYTAAANRIEWKTPPDLPAGTYTYFCRAHPFMRGAFRVEGTPPQAEAAPPPSRVSIASRRIAVDRRGRARVRLKCGRGGGCRGTLTLRRGRSRLATTRYAIAGGAARSAKLKLSRKARRLVRRQGSLRATAVADSGGHAVKRPVRLRRARR